MDNFRGQRTHFHRVGHAGLRKLLRKARHDRPRHDCRQLVATPHLHRADLARGRGRDREPVRASDSARHHPKPPRGHAELHRSQRASLLSAEGRDVSLFSARPSEQEIVLLPGATFAPASGFILSGGLQVQVLLGIPGVGERTLAIPSADELAALIDAARQTPVVEVGSPGRFGP